MSFVRKALSIPLVLLLGLSAAQGCSPSQERERVRDIKEAFLDLVEGRDDGAALLRYLPEEIGGFELSMEGGKYRASPRTLDDVELIFEDFARQFQGDALDILQANETLGLEQGALTWTIKVVDGSLERVLPVRVTIARGGDDGSWVVREIDVFD